MSSIETALKMEQEAVDFYRKCAEKTTNPLGKKMFQGIMEDEQYHIACALNLQKGRKVMPAKGMPLEEMEKLFEQHKKEMLGQVSSTSDDLEALTVAMGMEKESVEFYKNAAEQAASPEEKVLFDCLIKDEEEHFRIFQNTHSLLSDPGNWFMREEQGIVEG
ncbi:MAG: ferritin family protein [Nitrospirae bacterium]|nr:ferritin family protein [Nitrospirota bacterium]